jgi:hypothetical protein
MTRTQVTLAWVVVNTLVAAVFLAIASFSWIEPELEHIPGASGGQGLVWFVTAVPVFALAVFMNVAAMAWAFALRWRRGVWPATSFVWVNVALWFAVLLMDNSRHGA